MKEEIINDLITKKKAEEALRMMAEHNNNARLVLADYLNEKRLLEEELIGQKEFDEYNMRILNRIINLHNEPAELDPSVSPQIKASIFLSYNHGDMDNAQKIVSAMKKYGIEVRIDDSDVQAGQSISEFIIEQTKANKAVMILLSEKSLTSEWVMYESTMAMFSTLLTGKKIIPVKLDEAYFDDGLLKRFVDKIDEKIAAKRIAASELVNIKVEPIHIQNDIRRLTDARNQAAAVFAKFRERSTFSVAEPHFERSIQKIAEMLLKS